ncbi:MAG TPA: YdcH family protein [Bryobacteraceae bacterium]|nr:YdcH family protein [Bryobacteraceae bacterium]
MENNTQDELKAHLMATSEEFRHLATQHGEFHKQLEALEAKSHLTEQEQMEEVRLKKQKLRLKDQMNAILARSRTQQVA